MYHVMIVSLKYYLLYCRASESGQVDNQKHLTPVVTKWYRLAIKAFCNKIVD